MVVRSHMGKRRHPNLRDRQVLWHFVWNTM